MRRNMLLVAAGLGSTILALGALLHKIGRVMLELAEQQPDSHPIYHSNDETASTTTNGSAKVNWK